MTPASTAKPAAVRETIEELRHSLARMSGAERRLRSRDYARSGELTHAQLRAIAALGREKEMTVGAIARSAELTPATVTQLIDHLEAAEIVQRVRSTEDRRVCNVSLTRPDGACSRASSAPGRRVGSASWPRSATPSSPPRCA